MDSKRNLQGFLMMLSSALLFAFMSAIAHYLGQYYDWKIIAFLRNLIALALSVIFLGTFTWQAHEYRNFYIWFRCVIGGLGVLCTFYALAHTSISVVISIMNTAPIWVAIIRRLFYRDRIAPGTWAMILLGVTGVGLIEMPAWDNQYLPLLAANGSALIAALVQIFLHELADVDSRKVVFLFSLVATLISAVLIFMIRPVAAVLPLSEVQPALFFAALGAFGYLGQLAMTRAFALGHPTIVSLAALWHVIFALILDMTFFHRTLNPTTLFGVAFIVLSATVLKRPTGESI